MTLCSNGKIKLKEAIINSNNSTPIKEVKVMENSNERKNDEPMPTNRTQGNYNTYNTPQQKQRWKGNYWKKPFWKNNGHFNNYQGRPYYQSPWDRRSPYPRWKNYENNGERNNQYPDRARREERPLRDDGYFQYDNRRGGSPPRIDHYTIPIQNRYEHLQRHDDCGRSPWHPKQQFDRYEQERTPYRFLERHRKSPRRQYREDPPRRHDRNTPNPRQKNEKKRQETRRTEGSRWGEQQRDTPRRSVEKRKGKN